MAGLLTVPIPMIAAPVLDSIARANAGPQLSPLLGAIALFVVPSIVMGMVSPFAVRLRARAVATMGQTAGSLYALSTVGSIAGTLATSFVLINYLGVRAIITLMGFLLMGMAVLGWLTSRRLLPAGVGALVVVVMVAGGFAQPLPVRSSSTVYAKDTVYHRITISDEGSIRYLRLDNYWQSAKDRDNPRRTVFAYADYMHLPLIFVAKPSRMTDDRSWRRDGTRSIRGRLPKRRHGRGRDRSAGGDRGAAVFWRAARRQASASTPVTAGCTCV